MIEPMLDDPFPAVSRELEACPLGVACDAVLIDFHAETTSEKMAWGISAMAAPAWSSAPTRMCPPPITRSCRAARPIMSDAGMCGDYDSVIGMEKAEPLHRFLRKLPVERMRPAEGPATVCGVAVETDDAHRPRARHGRADPHRRAAVAGRGFRFGKCRRMT